MSSAAAVAYLHYLRSQQITPQLVIALHEVGNLALRISKREMQQGVYAHPIPLDRRGKPKWRRTGLLKASEERFVDVNAMRVEIVNIVRYAYWRHEMGKPGRRRTQFPAHWRDEMVKTMRLEAPRRFQLAIRVNLARSNVGA